MLCTKNIPSEEVLTTRETKKFKDLKLFVSTTKEFEYLELGVVNVPPREVDTTSRSKENYRFDAFGFND